jgi:hypothetical protein
MRCCRTSHTSGSRSVPPRAFHRSLGRRARHRPRRPCGTVRQDLLLCGQCCCRHRCRCVRRQFPDAARSDASDWVQLRNCLCFPSDHRHGSGRQHDDAGCAGDKPARRVRTGTASASTPSPTLRRLVQPPTQGAKDQVGGFAPVGARVPTSASVQPNLAHAVQDSAQTKAAPVDAKVAQFDADLASELIASGVTTQHLETVVAVLKAHRDGASINAAAKASGINYRTAQRIVEAAERRQRQLAVVS